MSCEPNVDCRAKITLAHGNSANEKSVSISQNFGNIYLTVLAEGQQASLQLLPNQADGIADLLIAHAAIARRERSKHDG